MKNIDSNHRQSPGVFAYDLHEYFQFPFLPQFCCFVGALCRSSHDAVMRVTARQMPWRYRD
jgi:hypothetical protein